MPDIEVPGPELWIASRFGTALLFVVVYSMCSCLGGSDIVLPLRPDRETVTVCVCVHRRRDGTYNMFNCTAVIAACAVTAALAQSPRV